MTFKVTSAGSLGSARDDRVFVWQRRAGARWLVANEERLREVVGGRVAIIQEPNRKTATVEIAGTHRRELSRIRANFGGTIKRLPPDWLRRAQKQETKSITIGRRLVIVRAGRSTSPRLIIPAGAAFGTGEHATTAMSLRFLDQITRSVVGDWSMLDLGTGSGVLALAARRLGAKRVVANDSDPVAIDVAKGNASLNRVAGIDFRLGDARNSSNASGFDVVAANLYSELLIQILPKLKRNRWLILSGILRGQETSFRRALRRNGIEVAKIRRRGKWIALLCAGAQPSG